ncbi:MAG: BA14K family protein [Hyphomicrobiaceae bacterium]
MKTRLKALACATLCAALLNIEALPAMAQPMAAVTAPAAAATLATSSVEQAQFRNGGRYRGGHRGGYRRGGGGGGIALGIGAAIIGGIILSESARAEHRSSHGGQWSRCAETYRSFESDTGMYTGYDGVRRTCPYLQ